MITKLQNLTLQFLQKYLPTPSVENVAVVSFNHDLQMLTVRIETLEKENKLLRWAINRIQRRLDETKKERNGIPTNPKSVLRERD